MFSTNARRAMCIGAGLILAMLGWIGFANYFHWYADTIGPAAWFGTLFLFAAIGVIAGLLFEKSTRARYQAAIGGNPDIKERMEKSFGRSLKFGYTLTIIWVAYRLFGYYLFFTLGFGLSPTAHLQLILSAVVEAVIALVSLLLYFERGENASTANIKKHLLSYTVFFFVLAIVDGVALLVLRPVPMASTYMAPENSLPSQASSASANAYISPSNSSLKIISPTNGQELKPGSTYTIGWQYSGDFVFVTGNMAFYGPGVGIFVAPATSSHYRWTVPLDFTPGTWTLTLAGSDQDFINHHFASSSVLVHIVSQ